MFQRLNRPAEQTSGMYIQPALEIGEENDEYEKEANAVADKVMRMKDEEEEKVMCMSESGGKVQQMCAGCEEEEKMPAGTEGKVQPMRDPDEDEKKMSEWEEKVQMMRGPVTVRKKANGNSGGMAAPKHVERGIMSSKENGQSLSPELQGEMGKKMGADFSGVKVHTDENAVQMNKEIGAKAFTHGSDIYFNAGQYNPSSQTGKHLLAHELTHTVQQNGNNLIQRAKWTDQAEIKKNPAELIFVYGQSPGQTTLTFNGKTPADLSPNNLLLSLLPPAISMDDPSVTGSDYKAYIPPNYEVNSSANMTITDSPNYSGAIPQTAQTEGWSWQINPANHSLLSGQPDLAGITNITAITFDPAGAAAFEERVRLGELHHVAELKRLHETYISRIEKRMLELEGRGSTNADAANALSKKIFEDEIITRNIDAYINDYDASDVHQYDQTSYMLHRSDLTYKGISADRKKISLAYKHRYTMELMRDPSNEAITAPGMPGEGIKYRAVVAPTVTSFDPSKLIRTGKVIYQYQNGPKLKSFKTEANAMLALETITALGFNTIERIGKYENFSKDGAHTSGVYDKVNSSIVMPDYFSVGYNVGWNLSEAQKRDVNKPGVRNTKIFYNFPDTLQGMNEAYSAFNLITAENIFNFHWIGGNTENPEMSFWTK